MREITSSPRAIWPLYSATWALTSPVIRSTSQTVTVVVPISMASRPQRRHTQACPGQQIDQARRSSEPVPGLQIQDGGDLPLALAQGIRPASAASAGRCGIARCQLAGAWLWTAGCKSSVWSPFRRGQAQADPAESSGRAGDRSPAGTLTSPTVRSVVSRRSIFSCGGTLTATSPSTTVWQARAKPCARSSSESRSVLRRRTLSGCHLHRTPPTAPLPSARLQITQPQPGAQLQPAACRSAPAPASRATSNVTVCSAINHHSQSLTESQAAT